MTDIKLLPCPFCGSACEERSEKGWYACSNHDCSAWHIQALEEDWNTRSGYTAVDMADAAADGFRDGAASVVVELPFLYPHYRQEVAAAIIAAGGRVKE